MDGPEPWERGACLPASPVALALLPGARTGHQEEV